MEIGALRHRVSLQNPGVEVPDADGGFTATWTALVPSPVWASIEPATERDLERLVANTVGSDASHVVTIRYHAQVTTKTRLLFGTRVLTVVGIQNPEERNEMLRLACVEQVA